MQPPRGPKASLEDNSLPRFKKFYDGQIMTTRQSSYLLRKNKKETVVIL